MLQTFREPRHSSFLDSCVHQFVSFLIAGHPFHWATKSPSSSFIHLISKPRNPYMVAGTGAYAGTMGATWGPAPGMRQHAAGPSS